MTSSGTKVISLERALKLKKLKEGREKFRKKLNELRLIKTELVIAVGEMCLEEIEKEEERLKNDQ